MKRKFLFLYLNTGFGHKNAAKILKNSLENQYPDCEVFMLHGFGENSRKLGNLIFEKVYAVACNYIPGLYPLIYDTAQFRFVQWLYVLGLSISIPKRVRKFILNNQITDVVSFHFALTPPLVKVLPFIPWKLNVTEVVTDPFNGSHAWYYERNQHFLVYSERAKQAAMEECHINPANIKVIPFLNNPKFKIQYDELQLRQLKIKHGFDPDKKIVLLVGGGEGLPGTTHIIKKAIDHSADFAVAVVCGKDTGRYNMLSLIARRHQNLDLHVFGFVDFLDELVKICSCAVIKAGPATLMEIIECKKPVIICKYIHNQEKENVQFATRNGLGWFIRNPEKIYDKICEILSNPESMQKIKENFERLSLDTDVDKAARILYENIWL